jgi:T5SS/PEP-CTERM-associated repeat protein/autotransporter-associated beta strand protein
MNASSQFAYSKIRICAQVILSGFLATAASTALGQTFWVGTTNVVEDWSTPGNWSLGVPDASSGTTFDAVIANGGGAQLSVTGASVRRFRVGRHEGPGQLFVAGGGLTVTENLHINEGGAGLGALLVSNGGTVAAPSTVVGYSSNGPSLLDVTGVGSKYTATNSFIVGRAGIGTLVLSDSSELAIGNGTLPLSIAALAGSTGAAYLGNGGMAGVLTASAVQFGPGDGLLGFNHSDDVNFAIPVSGAGRITKSGQGTTTLSASNTYTGHPSYDAGTSVSRGTLEVTNSISHPAANLQVGTFAPNESATLAIRGGTVTNANGYVGHAVESSGIVSVDGPSSTWTNGTLFIGYEAEGTLSITDGGHVTNGVGYVGYFDNAIGSVTVDGSGSSWTNSFRLFIGTAGTGSMHVTNGGQVTSVDDASIGFAAGSNGLVSVDGSGSAWTISDIDVDNPAGLYVGDFGAGSLSVTNGGVVNTTQATNGIQIGAAGTLGGDGTIDGRVFNYGAVSPGGFAGPAAGRLQITGQYWQGAEGALQIELASANSYDQLDVLGGILDGTLDVTFIDDYIPSIGASFDILDKQPFASLSGTFATVNLPLLPVAMAWDTSQLYTSGVLTVVDSGFFLTGDFNFDGFVDAADYVVWRKSIATQDEYNWWRSNFGATASSRSIAHGSVGPSTGVPEPASLALLALGGLFATFVFGRRNQTVCEATKDYSNHHARAYRSKWLNCIGAFSATLLVASPSARGGVFFPSPTSDDTIVGQAFDQIANPLGYRAADPDDRIGTTGPSFSDRIDQQKVFGFTLPLLDFPTISQATLRVVNTFTSPPVPFNVDLYGLNVVNPDGSGTSHFFEGANDPSQPKLADDLIAGDNSSPLPAMADVTAFIQSLYAGTTPNQAEAFFRLNPNVPLALIDSPPDAQHITLVPGSMSLIITTVVPEPASWALMFGALCLLAWGIGGRRRRCSAAAHQLLPLHAPRALLFALLAITSSHLGGSARAQDLFWSGGTGLWISSANWSGGQVPNSTRNAFINNGGTAQIGLLFIRAECDNLFLGLLAGQSGTVQVSGPASLTAVLDLFVGAFGSGNLMISDSGGVAGRSVFIGAFQDSMGTATMVGAGSTLTASAGVIAVGYDGAGTLTIESGATATSGDGSIGRSPFASGNVTVTDPGSSWNIGRDLKVGDFGTGALTVAEGGIVSVAGQVSVNEVSRINIGTGGLAGVLQADTVLNNGLLIFDHTDAASVPVSISGNGEITKISGAGDTTLSNVSAFAGSYSAQAGRLTLSGDANGSGYLAAEGGTLQFAGGTVNLDFRHIEATAGGAVEYDSAHIRGGFLRGPGTHTILPGAADTTLSATTTFNTTNIVQDGSAVLINFVNGGTITNNAPLTFDRGFNVGAITINSTLEMLDVGNSGLIDVNSGGEITFRIGDYVNSGGSRTTVHAGGVIAMMDGSELDLNGALLVNNGTIQGAVNVNYGSLARGTGSFGIVNVSEGGVFAPGNSLGIATAESLHLASTGIVAAPTLAIEIGGTEPGSGHDQMNVTGALSLGGTLAVSLIDFNPGAGQSFDILDWGSLSGTFASIQLPMLTGLAWDTSMLYTAGTLAVVALPGLPGDFNQDGTVDAADYVAWRKGAATQGDYNLWRAHFGQTAVAIATAGSGVAGSASADAAVPEPGTLLLAFACGMGIFGSRHRTFRIEN